jgi:hypothetical protein
LIRQKPLVSYDPFYDGWPTLCGHWPFAYAGESHERACGDERVVEMYVSLFCLLTTGYSFLRPCHSINIMRYLNFNQDDGSPYPLPVKGTAKLVKNHRPARENCQSPRKKIDSAGRKGKIKRKTGADAGVAMKDGRRCGDRGAGTVWWRAY